MIGSRNKSLLDIFEHVSLLFTSFNKTQTFTRHFSTHASPKAPWEKQSQNNSRYKVLLSLGNCYDRCVNVTSHYSKDNLCSLWFFIKCAVVLFSPWPHTTAQFKPIYFILFALKVEKTKEIDVDFRRAHAHAPLTVLSHKCGCWILNLVVFYCLWIAFTL